MPEIILLILTIMITLYLSWLYYSSLKENKQLKNDISILREDYSAIIKHNTKVTEEKWEQKFAAWKITQEKEIRKDAMTRSRNILRGQATEHLAPLMFDDMNPKDFRFLGNPIDYIIYDGASDIQDKESDTIKRIIFLDIKTGNSKLNKIQRRIRDCIEDGRIEFVVFNPDKQQPTKGKK